MPSAERSLGYDITRLFLAPLSLRPRGIDRVDLLLAKHFFLRSERPVFGVLPTPWGIRLYDADRVRRGIAHVERIWSEHCDPGSDTAWMALRACMTQGDDAPLPAKAPAWGLRHKSARMLRLLGSTGFSLGHAVRNTLPRDAIYLNVGQISMAVPTLFDWLSDRTDVTAAFMLHDVIPLDHPELVSAGSARFHADMVLTAARHADRLIVTTDATRATIMAAMERHGRPPPETLATHLPLAQTFVRTMEPHPDVADCRYFLCPGTLEPRKNHDLLLRVWQRLIDRMGRDAPHLAIAGTAGWRSESILAALRSDARLRGRVHHVPGLSTPGLQQAMLGGQAVLVPSRAEGFGLPLLESQALGVTAIASDIPAHREIATGASKLLPPDDVEAWDLAICRRLDGLDRRDGPCERTGTAENYALNIEAFIAQ